MKHNTDVLGIKSIKGSCKCSKDPNDTEDLFNAKFIEKISLEFSNHLQLSVVGYDLIVSSIDGS